MPRQLRWRVSDCPFSVLRGVSSQESATKRGDRALVLRHGVTRPRIAASVESRGVLRGGEAPAIFTEAADTSDMPLLHPGGGCRGFGGKGIGVREGLRVAVRALVAALSAGEFSIHVFSVRPRTSPVIDDGSNGTSDISRTSVRLLDAESTTGMHASEFCTSSAQSAVCKSVAEKTCSPTLLPRAHFPTNNGPVLRVAIPESELRAEPSPMDGTASYLLRMVLLSALLQVPAHLGGLGEPA